MESHTIRHVPYIQKLFDYSDTHVLDFEPNLKTLCLMSVIENNLDQTYLPQDIRYAKFRNCFIYSPQVAIEWKNIWKYHKFKILSLFFHFLDGKSEQWQQQIILVDRSITLDKHYSQLNAKPDLHHLERIEMNELFRRKKNNLLE